MLELLSLVFIYGLVLAHTGIHCTEMANVTLQPYLGQDYTNIQRECLKKGHLFMDKEFTKVKAMGYGSDAENYIDQDDEFMRPKDIVKDAKFYVDGVSRFDVNQGYLMDCWFASSLASLTLNKKHFRNVVPNDNSFEKNYAGIFHFRFWQYGTWIDVVVDDRLPVIYQQLDNLKSSEYNEFWSSLLEKAYAKIKGNYSALNGGEPEEALVDLTGGITVTHFLDQPSAPASLFLAMKRASDEGGLMAVDIYPTDSWFEDEVGLQQGHGYSITKVVELKYETGGVTMTERLVRVRNPYGKRMEWTGDWSDRSEKWNMVAANVRTELELEARADGEFWMTFDDFYKYFTLLFILYVPIPAHIDNNNVFLDDTHWDLNSFHGKWLVGQNAGGAPKSSLFNTNPQYKVGVASGSVEEGEGCSYNVFVGVMQKNRRERSQPMLPIGFAIYKISEGQVLDSRFFANATAVGSVEDPVNGMREASGGFCLPPGLYTVVPYTFTLIDNVRHLPKENVDFMLRVFTKK